MIISKSRKYTVNMGDYNSFSFESTVTLDTETDQDYLGTRDYDQIIDITNDLLVESLREEVNQARLSPNQKSAIQVLLAKRKVA